MKKIAILPFLFFVSYCAAQTGSDSSFSRKTYSLGEVFVSAKINRSSVTSTEIQKLNSKEVSSAIRMLPSVTVSSFGSRNEATVYIRGFDIRSIPVFIDGIPVYVPYDGYVDLSHFTTADLSKIDVSNGFSSMSFGANTIGGVINLVSIKPSRKLEIEGRLGAISGRGYDSRLNIGSNLGKIYFQTGFSRLTKQYIPLPASFSTGALENDHYRDNSASEDTKFSFKTGYTPGNGNEYSLNYVYSHGSKGIPVYLGNDSNTRIRYWQWPYWEKQSVYYISRSSVGERSVLKARVYFDRFRNKLSSYDDETYSTRLKQSSFNSYYDDHTFGGNLELASDLIPSNHLLVSLHVKNDYHSERNEDEPTRHFSDNTLSAGIEDVYNKSKKLNIITGLSYNSRKSFQAENYYSIIDSISFYPDNRSNSMNAQMAAEYVFSQAADLNFSVALKSRFATMKDRYSYRLGTSIPNPFLKPENAINLQLTSDIKINENLSFSPELFMSRLFNTIQLVSNVQDDLYQMQNTGRSVFSGIDFKVEYRPLSYMKFYAVYSFIRRKNLSNPEIIFTDVPSNKLFSSAEFTIKEKLILNIFNEYNSGSFSASDASRFSPAYFLLNARLEFHFSDYLVADAGINNISDRSYTVQEGYPEAGRNYYFGISFNIGK